MKLSDMACKAAKAKEKPYKISDGDGMYLLVTPSGSKLWRLNYRFDGKAKTLALGMYPAVSLSAAREKRGAARAQLLQDIDPSAHRAEKKLLRGLDKLNSFEVVAREWHGKNKRLWSSKYGAQVLRVMEHNLFPYIGSRPVKDVTPLLLLATLRRMEDRGATDLLKDALNYAGRVCRYGIATGRAERDPSADIKEAFTPHTPKNHPALKSSALPAFLNKLNAQPEGMGKWGIQLVLFTLVRTTEARAAPWDEFDLAKAEWHIPPERMKLRRPHAVPLSRQALALLEKIKNSDASSDYVFPSEGRKHAFMSENTMLNLIYEMGYKGQTTVHGLRTLGSTILHESGKFRSLAIERQLAHVDENTVRGVYNHAEYLDERRDMMQWWADYLDEQAAKEG